MKFLTLLLIILVTIPLVVAFPETPHKFKGTVSDDNGLVSSGTLTAKLCDIEFTTQIASGYYGFDKFFSVERKESCSDTNIEFYIDNHKIGEYVYEPFGDTELNFNIPIFGITSDDEDDNHHSGSSNVKSKMYPQIIVTPITQQEDEQTGENKLSDTTIETEQTSSPNLFSNLKNTTVKIVSAPFKTRKTTFFTLLIVCLLIFVIWYFIRKR